MILSAQKGYEQAYELFDNIGIKRLSKKAKTAIIKVNIAGPPKKNHPRTSNDLITYIVTYLYNYNVRCTIAEGADGYLEQNLNIIGLSKLIKQYHVKLLDLDFEEVEPVLVEDEIHYIPKCLNEYDMRIAIPATSKRPNAIFSNNVKLFVGAVPRKYYQIGEKVKWRPKIHLNLHKSVANIYSAIQSYSRFDFFVNGGLAMDEEKGEFNIPEIIVGDDGIELDLYVLKKYFNIKVPDYLIRLQENKIESI